MTEKPVEPTENMRKDIEKVNPKVMEILKFRCDQCKCTFNKEHWGSTKNPNQNSLRMSWVQENWDLFLM